MLADEMGDNPPVAAIKNGLRHSAKPVRVHAMIELVHINSRLLAIIRETWLIIRKEMTHQIHVGVVVHAHAEDGKPPGRILLRQINEQRVFFTAWLAPGGPKRNEQRLAVIFGDDAIVSGDVN